MKKFPKKILLLSSVPPCSNYSGGIVLEQLCRFLPKGSIVCYALMDPKLTPKIPNDLGWIPIEYGAKPADGWPILPFRLTPLLSFTGEFYYSKFKLKPIIEDIVRFGQKHGVDALWVTLQGQTMIRIALPIAKLLKADLFTEVWDPPEWWLKDNHIDSLSLRLIMRQFGKNLRRSKSCAVAGWEMAKEYRLKYRANTVPFLPSIDKKLAFNANEKIHSEKELIIGVAGQLYSQKEWNALLGAIDLLNWRIGKRKLKIRLLGSSAALKSFHRVEIEYLGWTDQEEAIKLMRESDILYCPYFFDAEFDQVSRLSFPSKLITYLAAGRPVFFHGPKYAAPGRFLFKNDAGLFCTTLNEEKIANMLRELVKNPNKYSKLAKNGSALFYKYFTINRLRQSFSEYLGVKEGELEKI